MKKNWLVGGILGIVAAIVYFASMADFAYPGESAHLLAMWNGLDTLSVHEHPLMAIFAKAFGGGNLLAPICGVLAVLLVWRLSTFLMALVTEDADSRQPNETLTLLAGGVSAVVFLLTPAVRESATHLEPRLFDAVWALATFAVLVPYRKALYAEFLYPLVLGALTGFGFCDSALFVAILPLLIYGIVLVNRSRKSRPYGPITLFIFSFLGFFVLAKILLGLDFMTFIRAAGTELAAYWKTENWFLVAIFTTVPFFTSLFSSRHAFAEKPTVVLWIFHCAMTGFVILSIATPLAPSALMAPLGIFPVVTSVFAAMTAGYLAAFWWHNRTTPVGMAAGGILSFVLTVSLLWNLFTFDSRRGAFADEVSKRILSDLGERTWFVTDGTLDDHLQLVAKAQGRELHLVALQRDLDEDYLASLAEVVREKKIGGAKNEELLLSLKLGVLPFVQDWFAADPTVDQDLAIFGAPDLWYSAGFKPVPEFLFFGADANRDYASGDWEAFDKLLHAPKGWGSYRLYEVTSPLERLRLNLRRHVGFLANNRGVWLQDHQKNDAAFDLYDFVLEEVDADNVSSLFNEIEMVGQKHPRAVSKKRDLERRMQTIVNDKNRRYIIWRLGSYYGYVRNPEMFVRLGFTWARSGRPGDALAQIRRAIDFVPNDKRIGLLNMMAALYASENDQQNSRRIYEAILKKNADDHDALVGLMRLKLLDGDQQGALACLEKAVANTKETGRRVELERTMIAMMRHDLAGARSLLQRLTDGDAKDMQAWGFLAAVAMQQYDEEKDAAARTKILKELEDAILPEMERQSVNPNDYYIQTTKAFIMLRQGDQKRRDARDALEIAARARPDATVTQDMVLGLDISLDDQASAERHAREMLRRNRNAPLANYVMGSLAIRDARYREAEAFLRRAVNVPKPNVLALNDLAEVLRRTGRAAEAEEPIRRAIELSPDFYILHETLGVVLLDQDKSLDEAEREIRKAVELSKAQQGGHEDMRIYMSLARVQIARGDRTGARLSIRRVESKYRDLSAFERNELEEIKKRAR